MEIRMQKDREPLAEIQSSRRSSRWILILIAAFIFSLPIFSFLFSTRQFTGTILLACLILTLEGLLIFPSLTLARHGRDAFSKPILWVGIFLIVGGIWLDVLSTVWNTPDMASEGNPFIVFMRENGFPLWSMYLVGFYAQSALTLISVLLWTAFMRHWRVYLDGLIALQPQTVLEYFFAAFGGRTWYAKTNNLRVSRSYRFLWLPILVQIVPFERWELGFEWMGFLPTGGFYLTLVERVQTTLVLFFFFSALVIHYWKHRAQIRRPAPNSVRASCLNLARSLLIGVVIFACAFCALTTVYVSAVAYVTTPPEGMRVSLKQSATAQVNQLFFIELEISNDGENPLLIDRIFLQSPGFPGLTETLAFVASDPPSALQNLNGLLYLDFDQTIAPGESKRLTLYFLPMRSGDFSGDLYIISGSHIWLQQINLRALEP